MSRTDRKRLVQLTLLGIVLRLAFLLLAEPLELWADEGQYIYQALAWNRFGFYLGSVGWVWPPGYPWLLSLGFRLFGEQGIFAVKLLQVLLSGVVGLSLMLLARRLFRAHAASAGVLAGVLWATYLPLIGYTHYLWPETVFLALLLPAIVLYLAALEGDRPPAPRLLAAGLCLGGAFLFKESVLPLFVFLPALVVLGRWRDAASGERRPRPLGERISLAAVLLLAAVAVFLPWTLRNHEVYGRWVPSGATLGENLYQGVNAEYVNYDYAGAPAITRLDPTDASYRWFVAWPEEARKWERSTTPNTVDKNAENAARAKRFVLDHPGFFLRSRVKKLADWVTPLSFVQRQLRLGVYGPPLGDPTPRRVLVVLATLQTVLVLGGGAAGLFLVLRGARHRWLLGALGVTFLVGALVVSFSRYRAPIEPLGLVLAAGLMSGSPWRASRSGRGLALGLVVALLGLWLVNAPEVVRMLKESLR